VQKDRAGIEPKPAKAVPEGEPGEGTVVPVGNGRVYGYAPISRSDSQDHEHQVSALRIAGATKIFTDEISGGVPTADRPGFRDAVSHLRPGDVLVAAEMSRISRSLTDLITTIEMLTAQSVTVCGCQRKRDVMTRSPWSPVRGDAVPGSPFRCLKVLYPSPHCSHPERSTIGSVTSLLQTFYCRSSRDGSVDTGLVS
jgi:hypothetical protein